MRLSYVFLLLIFSIVLSACNQGAFQEKGSSSYITFEEGGGFSGKMESWTLYPEGSVQVNDIEADSSRFIGSMDKKHVRQIFHNLDNINAENRTVIPSGSLYKSITYVQGGNTVRWVFDPVKMQHDKLNIVYMNFKRLRTTLIAEK